MTLLIDMGNSRLKWALLSTQGLIQHSHALANAQLHRHSLYTAWAGLQPRRVLIACVSTDPLFDLVQTVARELWHTVELIRVQSQARMFGVQNAYSQPEQLGVDRWLALLAARQAYTTPVCVIDCGTAITIDVLDAQGQHQGGLISAGLGLMQYALTSGTQQLPAIAPPDKAIVPFALANNTEAAIAQGTLTAAVGLLESVARHVASDGMIYVLTGGDAQSIAARLTLPVIIDSDLVLRGLALWTQENRE